MNSSQKKLRENTVRQNSYPKTVKKLAKTQRVVFSLTKTDKKIRQITTR